MKKLLLLICLLTSIQVWGQEIALPRFTAPHEMDWLLSGYTPPDASFSSILTPPQSSPRAMAEWEELQGLIITWTPSYSVIQKEIVRNAAKETDVYVVCIDTNSVKSLLLSESISMDRVRLIKAPYNSIWVRDFGPNPVYLNDVDSLVLVDWIYNRPRPKDDTLSTTIASWLNVPLYQTKSAPDDLVHTGGNFMSDGLGNAFSSNLVLNENGPNNNYGTSNHTSLEVDSIMKSFMGIKRYFKMDILPYDEIHHIDMHMKLLDEETLLVGQYPPGTADGPQIEANIQYLLSTFKTAYGRDFKVIRIPMPPQGGAYPNSGGDYRTYANAVFVNKTVLLPIYEQKYDTTALRIWREAMPGYNVVGIDCNSIITSLGAIHCITKEIGVSDPLWITHSAWRGIVAPQMDGYDVVARIQHRSGIESATMWYTTDTTAAYQSVNMTYIGQDNNWSAVIPFPGLDKEVFYYIQATSNSGKTGLRPITAPRGYYHFRTETMLGTGQTEVNTLELAYPNPARGITCIPVTTEHSSKVALTLHDIWGNQVQSIFTGTQSAGSKNYFIDAATLTPGTYFIQLQSGQEVKVQRLVVVN
ncbi:MAG: agmatine deiminase family protein [Saprospiraceae bacterium]